MHLLLAVRTGLLFRCCGACQPGQSPSDVFLIAQGAAAALQAVTCALGASLISKLPSFWSGLTGPLLSLVPKSDPVQQPGKQTEAAQPLLESICVLRIINSELHPALLPQLLALLPACWQACCRLEEPGQSAADGCIASLATAWTADVMPPILRWIPDSFYSCLCCRQAHCR